jgi:hypothetical protein
VRWLHPNPRERVGVEADERHGDDGEDGDVEAEADVPDPDERAAESVDAVGQRIEPGDDGEAGREAAQREQRPREINASVAPPSVRPAMM